VTDYRQILECSDTDLARVEPSMMNLLVAKSIPILWPTSTFPAIRS